MQTIGFQIQDLQRFSAVQKLAYEVVEAVQGRLQPGMTEQDAVRLLRAELQARGVTQMFHDPFAWFGERAAFKNFWINLKFLPSKTRLREGMSVILDIAPIVDGYSADIGYCFVHGGDEEADRMDRALLQVRDYMNDEEFQEHDHSWDCTLFERRVRAERATLEGNSQADVLAEVLSAGEVSEFESLRNGVFLIRLDQNLRPAVTQLSDQQFGVVNQALGGIPICPAT